MCLRLNTARGLFGLGCLAIISLFLSGSASAQVNPGTESGVPAYGRFAGGDFDQINLLNGNLHLDIPVLTVKERGRTFTWHFVYEPITWTMTWHPLPKIGGTDPSYYAVTRGGQAGLYFRTPFDWQVSSQLSGGLTCPGTNQPYQVYTGYSVTDPNGSVHQLPLRQEIGQYSCEGSTLSGPAQDGSGITYNLTTNVITTPDGTQIKGATIEDTNGNQASATGAGGGPERRPTRNRIPRPTC